MQNWPSNSSCGPFWFILASLCLESCVRLIYTFSTIIEWEINLESAWKIISHSITSDTSENRKVLNFLLSTPLYPIAMKFTLMVALSSKLYSSNHVSHLFDHESEIYVRRSFSVGQSEWWWFNQLLGSLFLLGSLTRKQIIPTVLILVKPTVLELW